MPDGAHILPDDPLDAAGEALLREPPQATEMEQALLGACMASPAAYWPCADIVAPEDFFEPVHGVIWGTIAAQARASKPCDPLSIARTIGTELAPIGGASYLVDLATSVVSVPAAAHYAGIVRDAALRRKMIASAEALIAAAHDDDRDAAALAEGGLDSLYRISETARPIGSGPKRISAVLDETLAAIDSAYRDPDAVPGVRTGLHALDDYIVALEPDQLVIVAGRPGMGKTSLAMTIAHNVARAQQRGGPVYVASQEMSGRQLGVRHLAAATALPTSRLRTGRVSQAEMDRLVLAAQDVGDMPLWIDDTAAMTTAALRARCVEIQRKHGLALVVVDYIQLLHPSAEAMRKGNRNNEVSEISRDLKVMAKELKVPVLALSQLSRDVEKRSDKRPMLADLRDSGSLEQDADVVLFVYREAYYLAKEAGEKNEGLGGRIARMSAAEHKGDEAEIIVAKQRQGEVGTAKVKWIGAEQRFCDFDEDEIRHPVGDPRAGEGFV